MYLLRFTGKTTQHDAGPGPMSRFFEQAKQEHAFRARTDSPRTEPAHSIMAQAESTATTTMSEAPHPIEQHLVSLLLPTSHEAEQYRTLRHVVERANRTSHLRVIGISSPGVGDGKTLTAINLAGALAQGPQTRVLLIDFDLRHPMVGSHLALTVEAGLAEALSNPQRTLDDVVQINPTFNLAILPARRSIHETYELLNSEHCKGLIEAARRQYDYVVLDLPSLIPAPDCQVLEPLIDGFLIVVAAHKTPRKLLETTLDAMNPDKVIGLIFNGDDRALAGYAYAGNGHPAKHRGHRRRWFRSFRATTT